MKKSKTSPREVERAASAMSSLNINNAEEAGASSSGQSSSSVTSESCSGGDGRRAEDNSLQKLSKINGTINKMSKEELEEQLKKFGLNSKGVIEVLKKRLKNYHRRQKLAQSKKSLRPNEITNFDFVVVIDFEATCEKSNENYVHEIIEFPAVLVDVHRISVTDVFQRYCKPAVNPTLSDFCTELTGITQGQVDRADPFPRVFKEFEDWLQVHGLVRGQRWAILTDGPWDLARFLRTQVDLCGIPFPSWARRWINVRKSFGNFFNFPLMSLSNMLKDLGMEFEGRPHCGIDDARNIAAITMCLLRDGCTLRCNEQLHEKQCSPVSIVSKPPPATRKKGNNSAVHDIPQEGESIDDLLLYARLQKRC